MSVQVLGIEELQRKFSLLERDVLPTAAARAINRVAERMKTLTVRSVASAMGVPQKSVRGRIVLHRARKMTNPSATLEITGKPLNLAHFKARQTRRGVTATPWARRRLFPGAFATSINGKRLVMVREKRGGKRVGRLPIRAMFGPGVAQTANTPALAKERSDLVAEMLPERLEHEVRFAVAKLLERRGRGR